MNIRNLREYASEYVFFLNFYLITFILTFKGFIKRLELVAFEKPPTPPRERVEEGITSLSTKRRAKSLATSLKNPEKTPKRALKAFKSQSPKILMSLVSLVDICLKNNNNSK